MARIKASQEAVFKNIIVRLIAQVDKFNAASCFISIDADPDMSADMNLWATVTLMDGNFGDGEFVGGAENTLFEFTGFSVNIFSRVMLDETNRAAEILTNSTLGLLDMKKQVLKALTGYDPIIDTNDNVNLANRVQPLNSPRPEYDKKKKRGVLTIHFGTDIDWDLT